MSYTPRLKEKYNNTIVPNLQKEFGYKSVMQVPRLVKICLNQGIGAAVADKKFEHVLGNAGMVEKAPGDTIFETTYAPNRLTYHANTANGGLAVFSEIYFPWGWTATIDGQEAEIGRVNYVLRALRIPAGSHTVEFAFEPKSVTVTETLAYIAIIIIYLAVIAAIAINARTAIAAKKQ